MRWSVPQVKALEDCPDIKLLLVGWAALLKAIIERIEREENRRCPGAPRKASPYDVYGRVCTEDQQLSSSVGKVAECLNISESTTWRNLRAARSALRSGKWDPNAEFQIKLGENSQVGPFIKIVSRKKPGYGFIFLPFLEHYPLPCDECPYFKTRSDGAKYCVLPLYKLSQSGCCLEAAGRRLEDI